MGIVVMVPVVLFLVGLGPVASQCPDDMVVTVDGNQNAVCMDIYEAPNSPLLRPLVMYNYNEAMSWCTSRGKRLCYEDEWTNGCAGPEGYSFPYGNEHVAGTCNDGQTWKHQQNFLNYYQDGMSTDDIESLEQLLFKIQSHKNENTSLLVDHLESLYQGTSASSYHFSGCVSGYGAFHTQGNVEEWTTRRVGGHLFHGNLKGRYWAETKTCQQNVTVHEDHFRFYELGFRCCKHAEIVMANPEQDSDFVGPNPAEDYEFVIPNPVQDSEIVVPNPVQDSEIVVPNPVEASEIVVPNPV